MNIKIVGLAILIIVITITIIYLMRRKGHDDDPIYYKCVDNSNCIQTNDKTDYTNKNDCMKKCGNGPDVLVQVLVLVLVKLDPGPSPSPSPGPSPGPGPKHNKQVEGILGGWNSDCSPGGKIKQYPNSRKCNFTY